MRWLADGPWRAWRPAPEAAPAFPACSGCSWSWRPGAVPVPSDLVMLLLGERVAAGALPLWLAAVVLELVAVVVVPRGRRGRVARVVAEGACPVCLALGLGRDAPEPAPGRA